MPAGKKESGDTGGASVKGKVGVTKAAEPTKVGITPKLGANAKAPLKSESAKSPAKSEPAKTEPAKTEPAKTAAKNEPVKTAAKNEPAKTAAKNEPAVTVNANKSLPPSKNDAKPGITGKTPVGGNNKGGNPTGGNLKGGSIGASTGGNGQNPFGVSLRSTPKNSAPPPKPKVTIDPKAMLRKLSSSSSESEYTDEEIEEEEEEEESTASGSEEEVSTKSGDNSSGNAPVRTTFRPPWVKEGPPALPMPANAWQLNKRGSKDMGKAKDSPEEEKDRPPAFQMPQLRKVSKAKIEPIQENGAPKEPTFIKPQLKPVPPKDAKLQSKEVKIPQVKLNSLNERLEREESIRRQSLTRTPTLKDDDDLEKAIPSVRNALVKQESLKKIPKAPPMPPPAPAMPKLFDTKELSEAQLRALESLRARPKTRPDWTAMLKDIEGGRKLNHVQCNDRSQPLLPECKTKDKFLYDSEKANAHNVLLKEIQQGINLKRVKTNDRSKPILEGLRKFRRQMTIEEQIIKSQSMASIPPEEIMADEADEMDDIDKVRDDLQSTKQLLALELRNKEAQVRENKKLLARIQNLEAELEKEKSMTKAPNQNGGTNAVDDKGDDFWADPDGFIIKSLKGEMEVAKKQSEELERKYTTAAEELDKAKSEIDELRRVKQEMDKRLQDVSCGKRMSVAGRKESVKEESEEENFYEDSDPESDGEDTEEKKEKKAQREVKMLRNKLRSYKTKEDNAKKERTALKDLLKKNQTDMKEEKKKYKALQKEVNKMAALMKESDEDEEEEDEEKDSETESESESESDTESSGGESDSEKSQSEDEEAPSDKKKDNLTHRTKRHENILNALKKGNYVLKTNLERLQDDLNKQKEATVTLQEDLDSVLSELG